MKRIHVVGASPRSGTTLMAEVLRVCTNIDKYADHEKSLLSRPKGTYNIFLTKKPGDIMIIGPSLRVDPDLYAIYMLRDPRDIICSKHRKKPNRYWTGLKFWKTYSRIGEKLVNHPRFLKVRYEQFVTEPDKVQAKLIKEISFLKREKPFSKFHETAEVSDSFQKSMGGARPIGPTSVGKWKNHKERVAGQLKIHGDVLAKDLIWFGYEEDDKWLNKLENVTPDTSPSHFSEYMSLKRKWKLKAGKYLEALRRLMEQIIGSRIRITHPKKWFR